MNKFGIALVETVKVYEGTRPAMLVKVPHHFVIEADSIEDARQFAADKMVEGRWDHPIVKELVDDVEASMWGNCLYRGQASGHRLGFCTADSCY